MTPDARVLVEAQPVGSDLTQEVDRKSSVDGYHVSIAGDDRGIVDDVDG